MKPLAGMLLSPLGECDFFRNEDGLECLEAPREAWGARSLGRSAF